VSLSLTSDDVGGSGFLNLDWLFSRLLRYIVILYSGVFWLSRYSSSDSHLQFVMQELVPLFIK
jgi:hypothetical protein